MGCAAAKALLDRGHHVGLYDPAPLPNPEAASWGDTRVYRAAYFESPSYVALALRAIDLWRQWEREAGEDLLLPTGVLYMGHPESELILGVRKASHEQGLSVEPAGERNRGWSPDSAWECLWEPTGGAVLAGRAYRHAAKAAAEAELLPSPEGDWDATLYACGAEAAAYVPWLPLRRQPMETHIFAAAQNLPEIVFACQPSPGAFLYGFPCHHDQGGFKAASHTSSAEFSTLPEVEQFLSGHLASDAPEWLATRSCSYDMTPDGHFLVGQVGPKEWVLSGFSGHGFKFAPALGEAAADLLEGTPRPDLEFLSPSRFR